MSALTDALDRVAAWDGMDPAAIESAVDGLSSAVRRFAAEVPPEETRGPEGMRLLGGANATAARALSMVLDAKLKADAAGDRALSERHAETGRKLREVTAQLARESAARLKP